MVLHSRNCGILSTGLAVSSRRNDGIKQAGILTYFSIQYEISKIVYRQGFPDGYYLDVYDVGGEKHEEFDDTFNVPESDTIQEYFRNLKPDTPKYLRLFEAELIVENLTVMVISIVNLRKKRKKYR